MMDEAPYDPVRLHLSQLLDQHFLRDGRDCAFEFGEPQQLSAKEVEQDQQFPTSLENLECLLDGLCG